MVNSISQHLVQDCFRITPSSDFGKYLGFPILNRNPRAADFHYILDKMRKKLSSWKVNFLTTARRITLAKSTLNAIPAYAMQYVQLPMKICNTIDKIQRDFLWGSTTHYIAWEKVTSPKDCGGLGLQKADTKNKALLTGLAWRLIMNQSSLWAKTLIMKTIEYITHIQSPSNPDATTSIDIQWFLPPLGFYKLNTDGSLSKNKGIGGIGGIIRNSSEGWMVGFHNQTHCHSHTMSEIEAFLTGLHITFTHNLFPLEVGIDSLEILQFLEDSPPTYSSIIMSCRSMLKKLGNPTVRYNFRQANMVADVLSKIGAKLTMTNQPQILLSP
ncbi:hypothetical protein KY289_010662 [Solanum tuberosum]|nr:hypothetical protein KY289_010662 [Solanum tuberosum]